jgi:magnesium-transporting ATPase (P-type)
MPNRSLMFVVLGLFVIQLFVVLFDPIQSIFRTVDLSAVQILICLGIAAVVVVTEELRKAIDRMVLARSGS